MNPRDARREFYRVLRDSSRSMRRSLSEAERLLALSLGVEEHEDVKLRRDLESEARLNPEWFVGCPQ